MRPNASDPFGYYPIDPEVLKAVLAHIKVVDSEQASAKNRYLTVFDPCAGEGGALEVILEHFTHVKALGVEINPERFKTMKDRIGKRLVNCFEGDMRQIAIAPGCISMLYYNPPYEHGKLEADLLAYIVHSVHDRDGAILAVLYYHNLHAFWKQTQSYRMHLIPHQIVWLGKDDVGYEQCALILTRPFHRHQSYANKDVAKGLSDNWGVEMLKGISVAPRTLAEKAKKEGFTGRVLLKGENVISIAPLYFSSNNVYMRTPPFEMVTACMKEAVRLGAAATFQDAGEKRVKLMKSPPNSMLPMLLLSNDGFELENVTDTRDGKEKKCLVRACTGFQAQLVDQKELQSNKRKKKKGLQYLDDYDGDEESETKVELTFRAAPREWLVLLFEENPEPVTLDAGQVLHFVNNNQEQIIKAIKEQYVVNWDGTPIEPVEKAIAEIDATMSKWEPLNGRPQKVTGVQRDNVSALYAHFEREKGALLAAEQGTGKTLMSIALLWSLYKAGKITDKQFVVIICPAFLVVQWRKQIEAFLANAQTDSGEKVKLNICALSQEFEARKKKVPRHEILLEFVKGVLDISDKTPKLNVLLVSETDISLYDDGVMEDTGEYCLAFWGQRRFGNTRLVERLICGPQSGHVVTKYNSNGSWMFTEITRDLPNGALETEMVVEPVRGWTRPGAHPIYVPLVADLSDETLEEGSKYKGTDHGKAAQAFREKVKSEMRAIREKRSKERQEKEAVIADALETGKLSAPLTGLWRLRYVEQALKLGKKPVPMPPQEMPKLPIAYWLKQIAKRNKGCLAFTVIDEAHRSKSAEAARSIASMQIAAMSEKTLLLTATPMSGYASTLHYIAHFLSPEVRKYFGIKGEYGETDANYVAKKFADMYGAFEVKYNCLASEAGEFISEKVGAISDRRALQKSGFTSMKEAPGISYVAIRLILQYLITARMLDFELDGTYRLPTLTEEIVLCEVDKPTQDSITKALAQISAEDQRRRETLHFIWQVLGMSVLNAPHESRELWVPVQDKDGTKVQRLVTTYQGVNIQLTNKEKRLAEIVAQEIKEGRGVCIFTTQVGVSRNIERILNALDYANEILEKEGCTERVCPFVLESDTSVLERVTIVEENFKKGANVLVTNPALVEVGVNLLLTPTLIYVTPPLVFATYEQSRARSRRLNQTKPCKVYYLLYEMTAEMMLHALNASKQAALMKMVGGEVTEFMNQLARLGDLNAEVVMAQAIAEMLGVEKPQQTGTLSAPTMGEVAKMLRGTSTDVPEQTVEETAAEPSVTSYPAAAQEGIEPESAPQETYSFVAPNGLVVELQYGFSPEEAELVETLVKLLAEPERLAQLVGLPFDWAWSDWRSGAVA